MKNIYKLLAGVIVMLIASAGLVAYAATSLPSSKYSPNYVLYPITNLQVTTMLACTAYLTWDKPQDPGGLTPAGLLGYRIYRDGVLIHYNSNPDSLFYYDFVYDYGTFTDSVTAYYDLTTYGYPGQYGESLAISACFTLGGCGSILPFFEPWDGGSFNYQLWTFSPSQGNWVYKISLGNPAPTASFSGMPSLTNYNHRLQSLPMLCEIWTCANIYVEFDSRLIIINPTSQEKLLTEIYYDTTWYPKDSMVNNISTGWIHHKIDITETAGKDSRIGFRAKGINSADIVEWDVDNIHVYAVCFKPPDFTANRTGNSVHLSWGIPCTLKKFKPGQVDSSTLMGYNVYRTDSSGLPPFIKINAALVADTEYTDVLPLTFNGMACYYVTAVYHESNSPPYAILCEPSSDTICVEYTSGITEQNEKTIRIFPNPVTDVLNIETDLAFNGVEILNSLGERVYSETFLPTKKTGIIIKNYPQGIYLIKLKSGKEKVVKKVMKN